MDQDESKTGIFETLLATTSMIPKVGRRGLKHYDYCKRVQPDNLNLARDKTKQVLRDKTVCQVINSTVFTASYL